MTKDELFRNIEYYFDKSRYVFPKNIYVCSGSVTKYDSFDAEIVKNMGLRIKLDALGSKVHRYYYGDSVWADLVTPENREYSVILDLNNLLAALQYSGISQDGFLGGTFRLSPESCRINPIFNLVPEDTSECIFKSQVSEIYDNPNTPWTKDMKVGHMYVTKPGHLVLCLGSGLNFHSNAQSLFFYSRERGFYSYSQVPRKVKCLVNIFPGNKEKIDNARPATIKQFLQLTKVGCISITSDSRVGKDLGCLLKPESPHDVVDLICSPEVYEGQDDPQYWMSVFYLDAIWKRSPYARRKLRETFSSLHPKPCEATQLQLQPLLDEIKND